MPKLRCNKPWTIAEIEFLTQNAATMKDKDIAKHLRRNIKGVREKRRKLNITKISGRGKIGLKVHIQPINV